MLIVGELLNASRKKVRQAIEQRDTETISQIAKEQFEAGADYLDVNAGVFVGEEIKHLKWLVGVVQKTVSAPCCIDSPDPSVIQAVMEIHDGVPFINSISLEKSRWNSLLPILKGTDAKIVALCMSDEGMPESRDQRLSIAEKLIEGLIKENIKIENIYIDPLVQPLGTNSQFGSEFLNSVAEIKRRWPEVHTMCGLSNISFGLPVRSFLNQTFMTLAIGKGLDGAIINPLDKTMMSNIVAAEALVGKDEFCIKYLKAYRNDLLC